MLQWQIRSVVLATLTKISLERCIHYRSQRSIILKYSVGETDYRLIGEPVEYVLNLLPFGLIGNRCVLKRAKLMGGKGGSI